MDFTDQDLAEARFTRCNLSNAVIRGSWVVGIEVDTHDLTDGPIWVNGIDVTPYVDSELSRRFPGRELKHASEPDGLRRAWTAEQRGPGPGGPLCQVDRHYVHGRAGQRGDALPSSLSGAGDVRARAEVDVVDRE